MPVNAMIARNSAPSGSSVNVTPPRGASSQDTRIVQVPPRRSTTVASSRAATEPASAAISDPTRAPARVGHPAATSVPAPNAAAIARNSGVMA